MGLCLRLWLPVNTVFPSASAATGVRNLRVEADSRQSMGFDGARNLSVPVTINALFSRVMFAPRKEQASMVARVSSLMRG